MAYITVIQNLLFEHKLMMFEKYTSFVWLILLSF